MVDQEVIDSLDRLASEWKSLYYAQRAEAQRLREIITGYACTDAACRGGLINVQHALEIIQKVRSGPYG